MYLSCHISVLSEIWVKVKDNVWTINPIPVTYFGNHACLTEGVPWNSSNFRVTFHSILVCDLANALVSVLRFSILQYFLSIMILEKLIHWGKLCFFLFLKTSKNHFFAYGFSEKNIKKQTFLTKTETKNYRIFFERNLSERNLFLRKKKETEKKKKRGKKKKSPLRFFKRIKENAI